MTREEIFTQLRDAMVEMFELEPSRIKWETTLREGLDLDSIDAIDMTVRLQQITGKKVALAELRNIATISDVVDLIEKHLR